MTQDLEFSLWHGMKRIRAVEEAIAERYPQGKMRCPTHLSIGQEGVPAAISLCLNYQDLAVSTHRGHAHYLAKGGNLKAMLAEIYGKKTGCSQGKGGSMHLIDRAVGFMGTSPIVGNSIPLGVGLALSLKLQKSKALAVVFVGEGATEEGVFYESVNFAVLKKLPVLFVCENNLYSVYSPLSVRQPAGRSIAEMTKAMGCNVATADGNDALATHALLADVCAKIRAGEGPYFVELSTYRWREHCGPFFDNDIGYRTPEEFEAWKARDPIARLEPSLAPERVSAASAAIAQEIEEAFAYAEASPFPEPHTAYEGEYA
jgi:TPP-dependent pyruvate/acetoin dehydrogenase alpha subunit